MSSFCQLWLTCNDKKEAGNIINVLLAKNLIACAKQIPITSNFSWQGKIEYDQEEVLVPMESRLDFFDQVEGEVAKLHDSEAFVLEATPMNRISKKARAWLDSELK